MNSRTYRVVLYLSFVYLLYRGVHYAFLESYLPLWVPGIALLYILLTDLFGQKKLWRFGIKVWAIFILVWVGIRFLAPVIMAFSPQVTESHIRDQFNGWQFFLNFLHLGMAYILIFKRKYLQT